MSTRGAILRKTDAGYFGVYHHSDSYPQDNGLGQTLWHLFREFFHRDLEPMLRQLIDEHPAGWATITHGKDFTLEPGYTDWSHNYPSHEGRTDEQWQEAYRAFLAQPEIARPQCFCHGERKEKAQLITLGNAHESDAEWVYAFDIETHTMFVYDVRFAGEEEPVAEIDLDDDKEPDWKMIACGADFSRCSHYAWYHFPELRGTSMERIGTAKFVGRQSFNKEDAIAFIVNGVRWNKGGHGYSSGYLKSSLAMRSDAFKNAPKLRTPRSVWIESCKSADGKERDLPVYYQDENELYPGVTLVYPPTLINPEETLFSGKIAQPRRVK